MQNKTFAKQNVAKHRQPLSDASTQFFRPKPLQLAKVILSLPRSNKTLYIDGTTGQPSQNKFVATQKTKKKCNPLLTTNQQPQEGTHKIK